MEDETCALCGQPAAGFAFASDVRLCHDLGRHCFVDVLVYGTPLPDGREWTGRGFAQGDLP